MSKGSHRLMRQFGDQLSVDDRNAIPLAPRRWSSETPRIEKPPTDWKHRAKSDELRTLIAIARRKNLFVREHETGGDDVNYSVMRFEGKGSEGPRFYHLRNVSFDEAKAFMEQFNTA